MSFASTPVSKDHWALVPVGVETSLVLRPLSPRIQVLEVAALLLSKLWFTIMIKLRFIIMIMSWDMAGFIA